MGKSEDNMRQLATHARRHVQQRRRFRTTREEVGEPTPEDYPFGVRVTALDPDGNRVSLRQRPS